jgi:hypothetical protein
VPLLAALLGAAIGAGTSAYVALRQIEASQRQVAQQIEASQRQVAQQIDAGRAGRVSDFRADTYGEFVSAVDRHLSIIGETSERSIRQADEDIFAVLRVVQLRGSATAYDEAGAIASRARRLTNTATGAIQGDESEQVPDEPFFAQQRALDRFVDRVQPELRR